jgi:DNA-binding response OmpR family regulator
MSRTKVLVVEDDALILISIIDVLEDYQFEVYEAATASHALDMLYCDIVPECLVIDVDLGSGMDGLQLASSVHKKWSDIGIIIVSGKDRTIPPDVPNAKFVKKPYDPIEIAAMIRSLTKGIEQTAQELF